MKEKQDKQTLDSFLEFFTVYNKDLSTIDSAEFFNRSQFLLSIGVFDGVHKGHQKIIHVLTEEARRLDSFSAILSFSQNPKFDKYGYLPTPLLSKEEKYKKLFSLGLDYIIELEFNDTVKNTSGLDFVNFLFSHENLKKLVVGTDFSCGYKDSAIGAKEIERLYPNRIIIVDDYKIDGIKLSSSNIREVIKKNGALSDKEKEEFF